jgi:hypothetical protein
MTYLEGVRDGALLGFVVGLLAAGLGWVVNAVYRSKR